MDVSDPSDPPPPVTRVLETALYVTDLSRAVAFYRDVMGFPVFLDGSPRLAALDAGSASVLLLFGRGTTLDPVQVPGGRIPPHDGHGPAHVAFAIPSDAVEDWERHLSRRGVPIESRVSWPPGGRSLYFRDPDGHSVELATPGTWPIY